MKIGITGDTGYICLTVAEEVSKSLGEKIDKISLFGDEWKKKKWDYDVLIHIAGVVPRPGVTKEDFFSVNAELSEKVAKKASADGCRHIVLFSTMAVYGMKPSIKRNGGIVCADTLCKPESDYGASKYEGENAFRKLESEKFRVSYLRIPSVYFEGNTDFIKVAKEMYNRFPKYYPKLYENYGRGAICLTNLCECISLIIKKKQYGIICPQDEPVLSLFGYMELIKQQNGNKKKPSALLGLFCKLILIFKSEWVDVFGQIRYEKNLSDCLGGEYRKVSADTEILKSLNSEKIKK